MRFIRVVNRHRMILIGAVVVAVFLGVVKHRQSPKVYQSSAKLMVRQIQADQTTHGGAQNLRLISSYSQLLLSDNVLIASVENLKTRPPELKGLSHPSQWPDAVRKMLSLTSAEKDSVISITCRSQNAESTVDLIRSVITESSRFMEDFQRNDALETARQLDSKREQVEERLFSLEREVLKARKESGDLAISAESDETHPLVQRVNHLNEKLSTIRSKRIELESLLTSVQSLMQTGADLTIAIQKAESILGEGVTAKLPVQDADVNAEIHKLNTELGTMETELASIRRHFGAGHSEVIRRLTQIDAHRKLITTAQNELRDRVRNGVRDPEIGNWLISAISTELVSTQQYELALQADYDSVEQKAMVLSDRIANIQLAEREANTLRELHSSLLNRLNSISIEPGSGGFRVAAITEPLVPSYPSEPVLSRILAMFVFTGVALSLAVIYVIDLMDDRLRSPEEVREELGLPVLGIIRRIPDDEVNQGRIYVHHFPQTPHAECFRTLKTALTLAPMETKCFAITSSEASEGKTTTTVNLAASYAQTGKRTLLIDADMRRPGLSRLLEVRGHGGLSEILRAESDIPEMCRERIVSTEVPLLDVLPCGPRILNAGMLLSMPTLSDILDWAVSEYDQVIVDCPPTLPVSDAAIVGRFVDAMLFLMNPDKTHRRSVVRAVDQLQSMGLKIVGIVANTSLAKENDSYGYQYGYGYGYSSDYSYGHDDDLDEEVSHQTSPSSLERVSTEGKAA
ncbi:MAG: polysaccharide biosynthesis tyrosine autokinase [Planctomycetaceae bacterium]|nr:polysaccharide biosynthesis tyrosine autokinase [Planctomycetaceae bacterium]